MPSPVLKFKRGASANIGVTSFKAGEPGFTTDKYDFYIGLDNTAANNKFFGSARYWSREDGSNAAKLNLVDKNGSNKIVLKSPNTLAGDTTYTLPATPTDNYFLKTNASGDLSWAEVVSTFNIAADSGTSDNVSTGSTITFVGGTNLNTAVTDNTITINLDNSISLSGIVTASQGGQFGNIKVGIGDANKITTSSGDLVLDPSSVGGEVRVRTDLHVDGNVTVGGTTITLLGEDIFIQNKDIVLGYTTTTSPNDTTANHGGVAIASTVGTPLADFAATGINTLPSTYKQLMWFQSGTLGFSTDAFAFNYGLAIGTTTMANGVRLAVGSGVTVSDTTVSATTFYGALSGSSSSADTVKTISAANTNATYYLTFVNSNNGSATNETVYTDDGVYYNPGTNTFTTQYGYFTGNITVDGSIIGTATTATRATTIDVAGVASNQNYNLTFTDGSGNGKSVGVDSELVYNPNTNVLAAPNINSGSIRASDGTTSITIDNGTGNVGINSNLTVSGNLYVLGTATEVSTTNLKVEDSLIDLGLVSNGVNLVAPSLDLNIDLGILFNWYSGSAKKAAVYWDDSLQRIAIASEVSESSNVLTASVYAPVEIGALWVTDCAGTSQVISCTGSERFLENITVDCGTF